MMDMPIGLTMAFAENLDSFKYFSSLTPMQQQGIIEHARTLKRQELKNYIQNLGRDPHLF
jgi:uncharacterized protein YdeI (YjbR/CyaY-like superfamily)